MKHFFLRFSIFSCLCTGSISVVSGQDVQFSQFDAAPLWRNPALMGHFKGEIRAQSVYRSQWASLGDAFQTISASVDYKRQLGQRKDFLSVGLQLLNDKAGFASLTTTNILPAIAYHKSLNDERNRYLTLGFMGGYVQRRFDVSKARTNAGFDGTPDEDFNNNSYQYWDGSVGMVYNSAYGTSTDNNYYIGVAYHHFNKPKNTFFKSDTIVLQPRIALNVGVNYRITDYSYLSLQGDFFRQGSFEQFVFGGIYHTRFGTEFDNPEYTFGVGAYIRWNDAFIPVVKLDYKQMLIGLSYDANISPLKTATQGRGGFELSLGYKGFLSEFSLMKDLELQPTF